MSLIESLAQVVIGYFVSLGAQLVIFPLFGMRVSLTDNLLIGMCFLIVSLARSYLLRRLFNAVRPTPMVGFYEWCKPKERDPYAEPWA
jgi:hypothetical protein